MRCDYYIEKKLYIYYNDNSINYINLKRDKGYYDEIYDDINLFNISNDDSSNSIWKKLKEYHLQHRIVLYLIYSNNSFNNVELSNKYKEFLEYNLINNYYKTWNDIKKIVIIEEKIEND